MKPKTILGIIAEYDPFHNGHARHLSISRQAVRPDAVYIVLSPCMKQRGALSLLSPFDRAACALHEGADAVFSLPVLWTVRSAEDYALGGVSLLAGLGVTHLAFGAESDDIRLLERTADLLDHPPVVLSDRLHELLSEGYGYPAAVSRAAAACLPEAESVLSFPNNILAVSYLRAIHRLNVKIEPVLVPRNGGYHDEAVVPGAPSASALRSSLLRGIYHASFAAMPSFSAALVRRRFLEGNIPSPEKWDLLVTEHLRGMDTSLSSEDPEGVVNSLRNAAAAGQNLNEILKRMTSRRYPASRISRLCTLAVLGVSGPLPDIQHLPAVTRLLALRKKTALTDGWKDLPVRICSDGADWKNRADPHDLLCWKRWSLCCGLADSFPFTEKLYTE